jgi:cell fate (sporulation/competence/biofilm development) regulator YmcA (YheA/YmcA/DUF963 family)
MEYASGNMTEFTKQLVEMKAIRAPMGNDYNYEVTEDQYSRILQNARILPQTKDPFFKNEAIENARRTLLKPIIAILNGIKFTANTFEASSKIAGAKIRIEKFGEGGKSLAYNVRNYTGTPNYMVKGSNTKTSNEIFVFSNIMKESLKREYRLLKNPKTRGAYLMATLHVNIIPKMLMFALASGLLGDDGEEMMENVSEYDKTNYIIIPFGRDDNGKTVYQRIPHDEGGRLFAATFWKLANADKENYKSAIQDIFSLGAGQFPSATPAIGLVSNWGQYLTGRNPYNAFKGTNLIDDTTWQAGGGAALKKMVQSTTNTMGLTKFATFDTSKNTGIETFLQVTPLFSTALKISDYGKQEALKSVSEKAKTEQAKRTLKEREVVQKYVQKTEDLNLSKVGPVAMEITKELLGHGIQSTEDKKTYDRIVQKVKIATKKELSSDPRYLNIINSGSNDEKIALLKSIKEDSTDSEWQKIKQDLLSLKIVSYEVINTVAE